MRYLPIAFIFWCLTLSGSTVAQPHRPEEDIRASLIGYWSAVQRKDHVATLAYIDPRLFALIPRSRMLDALERSSADTTVRVTLGDAHVEHISRPVKDGAMQYAAVEYAYDLHLVFSSEADTDQQRKTAFLTEMLEQQYGKGHVHVDGPDGAFVVEADRDMVAILDPTVGQWRFIERKPGMDGLLQQLVPVDVLRKLK